MPARQQADVPEAFRRVLRELRDLPVRSEVSLEETPAPSRLAPHAVALTGEVTVGGAELASGRLVVLHDPAGLDAWQGRFRVVAFVRAQVEPEIAGDPLLPEVGWSWLTDALTARGAGHVAPSGTVTRVVSESFGTMAGRDGAGEIEMRASWTPLGDSLAAHASAWVDLMCTAAGLPPLPDGVVAMPKTAGKSRARTASARRRAPR